MAQGGGTSPGVLYVVATPIGNLDDLTLRAQKTLAACDAVLAEDTRRTRHLLAHLGLDRPVRRFDAHVEAEHVARVVEELAGGATLALVSDAGTPLISDPGAGLVAAAAAAGVTVVAVPGASAVLCALAASGLAGHGFRFFGFLPRSGGERAEVLARVAETEETVVLYEAGNRTVDTLRDLAARHPDRPACVGRELTKLHEELLRGTAETLAAELGAREAVLGEVTIVLGPRPRVAATATDAEVDARIDAELAAGRRAKEAADVVAAWSGRPRRDVYARVVSRSKRA